MCCDICPYFEECQETEKLDEKCCSECPDFDECMGKTEPGEEVEEEEEEEKET